MTDAFAIDVAGRVNLIGDHTDYQAGLALPFALDGLRLRLEGRRGGEEVVLRPGSGTTWRLPLVVVGGVVVAPAAGGARYAAAVLRALADAGHATVGFDATLDSSLPIGAGLSSSAALEIAVALAACAERLEPLELARICQRAENEYVGVPCGLLDQVAIAAGTAGHALLLDFRELEAERRGRSGAGSGEGLEWPRWAGWAGEGVDRSGWAGWAGEGLDRSGWAGWAGEGLDRPGRARWSAAGVEQVAWPERLSVAVVHSGVERRVGDGAYARRRAETEQAAQLLGVETLREVDADDLTRGELPDLLERRARHVVSENARVRAAAAALRAGDDAALGAALSESQRSLAHDFEVSTPELDLLVELLAAAPGVIGARLTGAGFGGCAIAVVREPVDHDALDAALAEYERRSGNVATRWTTRPGQGISAA